MDIARSAREREVAELVADGLTDGQIAERLVISDRTAERHVEQIRNNLHSRTQIAGWVAYTFDANGDPIAPVMVVYQLKNGAWKFAKQFPVAH